MRGAVNGLAVSVLVIVGLILAWTFGAVAMASWSYTLVRDTGAVLLDKVPNQGKAASFAQL